MCFRKRFLTRFWVIFKVFGINVEFVIRQPMANCKGQYLCRCDISDSPEKYL